MGSTPKTMTATPTTIGITNILRDAITPSRHIPIIPSNLSQWLLSIPPPTSLTLCWECVDSRYLLLQYITSQVTSKYSFHLKNTIYPFSDSLSSLVHISNQTYYRETDYVVIPPLLIAFAFNLLNCLTKLLSYIHYPRFSFSMPFGLFSLLSSIAFGTYNDVTGNQTNTTFHGDYYISYNFSSLTNVPY